MASGMFFLPALFSAQRFCALTLLLIFGSFHVTLVKAASIAVDSDCTLAHAIESANQDRAIGGCAAGSGADSIDLTANITLVAELPSITSPIAIMGSGFAISGDHRYRIFFVAEDGDLTIDSLTLQDGEAQANARTCIDWEEGEWTAGGAICNLGELNISDSHFSRNWAEFGGAIASVGTLTIFGSDISGNLANSGGAIINWDDSTLTITGSDFSGNSAKQFGEDLASDTSEDTDTPFAEDPAFYDGNGGAIANSPRGAITITKSNFSSNSADLSAGAILNRGTIEIIDSQFTDNSCYGSGGAIDSGEGTLTTVTSSVFSGNSAFLGGAVFSWGKLTIDDSRYSDNRAVRGGAIQPGDGSILTIRYSEFSGNAASDSGGAIFGCVYCTPPMTVTGSDFSGNSANMLGGAIFGYGTLSVDSSQFSENSAGDSGGAIRNDGTLTLSFSVFRGNSATYGGGISNTHNAVLRQVGNTFSDNIGEA